MGLKNRISTTTVSNLKDTVWKKTMEYKCTERISGRIIRKARFGDIISKRSQSYILPGLGNTNVAGAFCSHMVPQGICMVGDYVLISAYCYTKEHHSVFYVLRASDMEYECTLLTPEMAHLGGIAYDKKKFLWACISDHGQQKMHGYDMSRLAEYVEKAKKSPNNTADIFWEATCDVDTVPSFCTFYDEVLWVGTFRKKRESIAIGYIADGATLKKRASMKVPPNAQGMTFFPNENRVVQCAFSTSWGRKTASKICTYRVENYPSHKWIGECVVKELALIEEKTISMPSMMEGIHTHGSSVYAIFESAASKYRNGDGKGRSIYPCDRICEFEAGNLFM